MPCAAFLVEPQPRAPALLKIALDPERNDRTDASEGVAHQAEQGALAKADEFARIDSTSALAHLGAGQHRRLATRDHELEAAHRAGRGKDQDRRAAAAFVAQ